MRCCRSRAPVCSYSWKNFGSVPGKKSYVRCSTIMGLSLVADAKGQSAVDHDRGTRGPFSPQKVIHSLSDIFRGADATQRVIIDHGVEAGFVVLKAAGNAGAHIDLR